MNTCICTNIYSRSTYFTSFSSNLNYTFCGTTSIKNNSCRSLKYSDLFYFGRQYVVSIAYNPIDNYQVFIHTPDVTTYTTNQIFNKVKAVCGICFFCHFLYINDRDSSQQIPLVYSSKSHLHFIVYSIVFPCQHFCFLG